MRWNGLCKPQQSPFQPTRPVNLALDDAMKISMLCVSIVLTFVVGCLRERGSASDVIAEAAENEFGAGSYSCAETIAVAKSAGIDYRATVDRCLAKDKDAMAVLFKLSKDAGFDAASAQGHAAVMGSLLRTLGDRFFSQCLSSESSQVQDSVRDYLLYDLGVTGGGGKPISDLKKEFPRTFPKTYSKDGFD